MKKKTPLESLDVLTSSQVAALLSIHPFTLRNWRNKGISPPFFRVGKLGSTCLYRKSELEAWMKTREVKPVGKAA